MGIRHESFAQFGWYRTDDRCFAIDADEAQDIVSDMYPGVMIYGLEVVEDGYQVLFHSQPGLDRAASPIMKMAKSSMKMSITVKGEVQ